MEAGAAVSQGGTGSPDWNQFQLDILCPLCDYNLRGLSEPRCPECGYQFTWAGLQDDLRNHHPWLFEHQKTKRIRALLKTWFISQFPRKLWKAVQPTHTPRRDRLAIYSLVSTLLMIVILIGAAGVQPVVSAYYRTYQSRQRMLAMSNSRAVVDPRLIARFGSRQAAIDANLPPYPSVIQVFQALRSGQLGAGSHVGELMAELGLTLISWPWVTMAALLIFQQTLRRARIKTVHVVRCVVYSSDVALLLVFPAALILSEQIAIRDYPYFIMFRPSAAVTILALFVVLTYRLSVAYRRYLHFPHAVAACISSQVIFILLMFYFLPWYIA